MRSLVDNDVLVKGSCYGLLQELAASVSGEAQRSGILGAARFVVPKLIQRQKLRDNGATAHVVFQQFMADNEILEPTADEQRLAADFEATAQSLAVNLDFGESQLAAILLRRAVPYLLTGDKRAIVAMEQLVDTNRELAVLAGRIKCLEQLIKAMLGNSDDVEVRRAICAEPAVDKALSICFSCTSQKTARSLIFEGLDSYIADLRAGATRVLSI